MYTASILLSCSERDEAQLEPINTSLVKISATIKSTPNSPWLIPSQQLSIKITDVEMTSPQGVILENISLIANDGSTSSVIANKPFSGEDMEFKVPLTNLLGRVNFSLIGTLIKKGCRDTEIIIADNIEQIIFSSSPEFECQGRLIVSVHAISTTGEEYKNSFEVTSTDHFTITLPQEQLYWEPSSGTASTIDVTLGSGATVWSPNTTFTPEITKIAIGHSTGDESTARFTISNTPGSLEELKLQMYVITSVSGTWENVTIEPFSQIDIFSIKEN